MAVKRETRSSGDDSWIFGFNNRVDNRLIVLFTCVYGR